MLDTVFKGLFDTSATVSVGAGSFLICLGVSIVIGIALALAYSYRCSYTKSFVVTLSMIPAVVCIIIMLVNGNIGTGVAIAGAFSLVRFRSAPGTAREIGAIFLAMGAGLATGMGYIGYAVLFSVVLGVMFVVLNASRFGERKLPSSEKTLRITVPEDVNFDNMFNDLLGQYTDKWELVGVRTTNMGSLFRLTYNVTMKRYVKEKEFIDALRCRNSNLEVNLTLREQPAGEL